jgi:hypothetical protein
MADGAEQGEQRIHGPEEMNNRAIESFPKLG